MSLFSGYSKALRESSDKQHELVKILLDKFVFALLIGVILSALNFQFWFDKQKVQKRQVVFENQMHSSAQVLYTLSDLLMKMHSLVELRCKHEWEVSCGLKSEDKEQKLSLHEFNKAIELLHPVFKESVASFSKESVPLRIYMGAKVRKLHGQLAETLLEFDITDGKAKELFELHEKLRLQSYNFRDLLFEELDQLKNTK